MGFGALLTTSDKFRPLGENLMRWIVEVRVEQELSKPTLFAVRFEDDLCGTEPAVAGSEELKPNSILGIFVGPEKQPECLVYGPITRVRTSSMIGGTGSWVEVRGQDQRIEMDRVGIQATYTGKASDTAAQIIHAYGHTPDCEETRRVYSEGTNTLSQRVTDLAFLEEIARRNNLELWLSYQVSGPLDTLHVDTTVKLRSSPPRPTAPAVPNLPPTPPILQPSDGAILRVQPPPSECASITRFDTHIDFERPNSAQGFAQALDNGQTVKQEATPAEATLGADRQTIVTVDGVQRRALVEPVTDEQEHYLAQEALLTEAAWFVTVDCSSTHELLGFTPQPHQILDVQYAGTQLSGAYQVLKSTHIINAADHFVDFKIRANGLRSAGGSR